MLSLALCALLTGLPCTLFPAVASVVDRPEAVGCLLVVPAADVLGLALFRLLLVGEPALHAPASTATGCVVAELLLSALLAADGLAGGDPLHQQPIAFLRHAA